MEIEVFVRKLRTAMELDRDPFDVHEAVKRLEGRIEVQEVGRPSMIRRVGRTFVFLLPTESVIEHRFQIARHLGHLFLHMGFCVDWGRWDSVADYIDSVEHRWAYSEGVYEAKTFAYALLMSSERFTDAVMDHVKDKQVSIHMLAEHFRVPAAEVRAYGRGLRLFSGGD